MFKKLLIANFTASLILTSCRTDNASLFNKWSLVTVIEDENSVAEIFEEPFTIKIEQENTTQIDNKDKSCIVTYFREDLDIDFTGTYCFADTSSNEQKIAQKLLIDSIVKYDLSEEKLKLRGNYGTILEFWLVK